MTLSLLGQLGVIPLQNLFTPLLDTIIEVLDEKRQHSHTLPLSRRVAARAAGSALPVHLQLLGGSMAAPCPLVYCAFDLN